MVYNTLRREATIKNLFLPPSERGLLSKEIVCKFFLRKEFAALGLGPFQKVISLQ